MTPSAPMMDGENAPAAKLAKKMGLNFTCDARTIESTQYVRFQIQFPEMPEHLAKEDPPPPAWWVRLLSWCFELLGIFGAKRQPKTYTLEESTQRDDAETRRAWRTYVAKVTKWRTRVKAWTIDPPPPGETGVIVAAGLTFGDRFKVEAINKANRARMVKFWSGEAMARRSALSQTEPRAALKALSEQLEKYGVDPKKLEPETLALRAQLEKACAIVELDGDSRPAGVTYQ